MRRSIAGIGMSLGVAAIVAVGYLSTSGQYVEHDRDTLAALSAKAAVGDTVQWDGSKWGAVAGTRIVSSVPDGSLTATANTLALNTTNGVLWQNRNGGTIWDPVHIPLRWGYSRVFDCDSGADGPISSIAIGGGAIAQISADTHSGSYCDVQVAAASTDGQLWREGTSAWTAEGGMYHIRARLQIPTLSDGTDNIVIRAGAGDAASIADNTDGAYLEYDFGAHASQDWYLCAAKGGTRTKVDTGIPPVAGTWTTLEIIVSADASTVSARIDGNAAASTVTTNIPTSATAAPGEILIYKSLGSSARHVYVDDMDWWRVLNNARFL